MINSSNSGVYGRLSGKTKFSVRLNNRGLRYYIKLLQGVDLCNM